MLKRNQKKKKLKIRKKLWITKGEISDYTVNTFTTLCGKAIEHFSMIGNEKYMEYVEMMKNVLNMEGVNKLTIDDEKEIKEHANKP